jgi:hypothetical protein
MVKSIQRFGVDEFKLVDSELWRRKGKRPRPPSLSCKRNLLEVEVPGGIDFLRPSLLSLVSKYLYRCTVFDVVRAVLRKTINSKVFARVKNDMGGTAIIFN